jgi:hypothetical protein
MGADLYKWPRNIVKWLYRLYTQGLLPSRDRNFSLPHTFRQIETSQSSVYWILTSSFSGKTVGVWSSLVVHLCKESRLRIHYHSYPNLSHTPRIILSWSRKQYFIHLHIFFYFSALFFHVSRYKELGVNYNGQFVVQPLNSSTCSVLCQYQNWWVRTYCVPVVDISNPLTFFLFKNWL